MSDKATGKAIGGKARAASLSSEDRSSIAKKAAESRWASGPTLSATHGDDEHPLRIGDIEIPCYVLEDETRVLSQRGVITSLGMGSGADRLAAFAGGKGISPYISSELAAAIRSPIKFRPPRGGAAAYGYPATILADLCEAVLAARKAGALMPQQSHIAEQCEILVRGLARVGIIALVDEATGYQKDRSANALAKILEAFIAKELQPWVRTFPADYYEELFRLRGLPFPTTSVQRPQYFGVLTNDIVYKRLAPGVLDELKKVTDRNEEGRPKHKFFQKLTTNVGYPKLREHLGAVVAVMKLSDTYQDFILKLDRLYPRHGDTLPLPLPYESDKDSGQGI